MSNTEVDYTYKQPFLYKCNQYKIVSFYKQCIPSHNFNTIYFDSKCIHHFSVFTSYCNITFHYCTHIYSFFIKQYHLYIITPFSRIYMLNIETVLYYCNAIFYAYTLCRTFIAMYIVMSKCRKKESRHNLSALSECNCNNILLYVCFFFIICLYSCIYCCP